MARKSMRSFRLSDETQKQLVLITTHIGIHNQTEALEIAVQDYYYRLMSDDVDAERSARETMGVRASGTDEALARQWDGVADSFESDETLTSGLREAVSRAARGTARNLRAQE